MLDASEILVLAKQERNADIISMCEKEIKDIAAKSKGGISELKRYKTALELIEEIPTESMRNAYIEDGKQYFTNSYAAFELNDPIQNLPEGCHYDIKSFLEIDTSAYEKVDPLDIIKLKTNIQIAKAERKASKEKKKRPLSSYNGGLYVYKRETKKWACSSELALKVIYIIGEKYNLYLPNSDFRPALFENEKGRAILMPIRQS